MHKLEWKKQARNDLIKIVQYISVDNPDAADKLADAIQAKAENLKQNPELSRAGRKRGTRELVVHPHYIVIYRVLDNTVEILRLTGMASSHPRL